MATIVSRLCLVLSLVFIAAPARAQKSERPCLRSVPPARISPPSGLPGKRVYTSNTVSMST